ncbi:uncharacterized protein LOC131610887 [Vicia villosa]|uniref:uncharacterized protein LOC131610887 n=1 Tax=Vicia villosa TaxID=3911 RepID=UPI00273B5E7E|nr:uncharacterized protein LOC131610887 [Vicia villosa]XP_058738932.1 uncharacterized protein LOC131610887 [Vicia villosa]
MAKTNKKRTGKSPGKRNDTSHCLVDPPACDNRNEDDDWVIVKKQRVIIMVPAAPLSERSSTENEEPNHMHPMPPVTSSNQEELPTETGNENPSCNEQEKTVSLAGQAEIHTVTKALPPLIPKSPSANSPRVDQRVESENPHQVSSLKSHKLVGLSNTSKAIKQPRTLPAPRSSSNLATLNRGLRASNLERKLGRAGGLNEWLTSLGLDQFVRMFQGKIISKYQLVNLTMKKLKDMGANAVGPRRKLIHAMDCVCQPYCFEAL